MCFLVGLLWIVTCNTATTGIGFCFFLKYLFMFLCNYWSVLSHFYNFYLFTYFISIRCILFWMFFKSLWSSPNSIEISHRTPTGASWAWHFTSSTSWIPSKTAFAVRILTETFCPISGVPQFPYYCYTIFTGSVLC